MFTLDERVAMVLQETRHLANGTQIEAKPFDNLLMHFARDIGAQMIVRGLRAVADFEYEFQMTAMNQQLDRDIETVFLMADPRHQVPVVAGRARQLDRPASAIMIVPGNTLCDACCSDFVVECAA